MPKPVAASLLWYTTAATQVFSIIQTCRRVPALIHAQARFRPSLLHKAFALTLLWCMGLTRRKASHHPNPPPRASFGTRPGADPAFVIAQSFRFDLAMVHGIDAVRGIASSKSAAASLLWYTTAVAQAFSIIQPVAASLLWYTTAVAQAFSIIQTRRREPALVHDRRDAGLQHHPNLSPRACFGTRPGAAPAFVIAQSFRFDLALVHGIDAAEGIASSKPAAASLLWYTTAVAQAFSIIQPVAASLLWYTTVAAQAFGIIQKCRREPALVHAKTRFRPSLLPKVFALTLLWCMGLAWCEASHHPNLPPRASFGTRPSRRRPSASSKSAAASLLWYTTVVAQAFSIIQTRRRELALVHDCRGACLQHHPKVPPRACFGTRSGAAPAFAIAQSFRFDLALVHGIDAV